MFALARSGSSLFAGMEKYSDNACLVERSGNCLTYSEVMREADRQFAPYADLAPALVFIHARNDVDTLISYIGATRAGFAVHLLDPDNRAANAALVDAYLPDIIVDPGHSIKTANSAHSVRPHPDLAILLATSGSTGSAKLVKLSGENIVSNTQSICDYLPLGPADRGVTALKPFYSYGLSIINTHIEAGASLLVTDEPFELQSFWDDIQRLRITNFSGVPHHFERIAQMQFDLGEYPHLRFLTQAGGKLSADLVKHIAEQGAREDFEFYVMYGQTEAAPRMSYLPPSLAARHPASIGVPIPGGSMWLTNEDGDVIDEPGVVGELVYAGPNVMCGYASGRGDLAELTPQQELRTGDLAEFDQDGLFTIRGRASRFVKPFGLRLSLDDVESAIQSEYGPVAVVGDDRAIVVALDASSGETGQLAEQLALRYRLPASIFRIEHLSEMPRLSNGKTDYLALRQRFLSAAPRPGFVRTFLDNFIGLLSGRAAAPESVFAAFRMVLADRVTDDTCSFRSVGGDSLALIELQLLLEQYVAELPENWPEMPIAEIEKLRRTGGV